MQDCIDEELQRTKNVNLDKYKLNFKTYQAIKILIINKLKGITNIKYEDIVLKYQKNNLTIDYCKNLARAIKDRLANCLRVKGLEQHLDIIF